MKKNIFFSVPLPFLLTHEGLLGQYPQNVEVFVDGEDLETLDASCVGRTRRLLDSVSALRRVHGPISDMILGASDPRVREISVRRFIQAIDFAGEIGAAAVVLHSGYDTLNKRGLETRYKENLEKSLGSLCSHAASRGIVLVFENTYERTPDLFLEFIGRQPFDNLKICFDVGHHNIFGKAPLEEWISRCAPLIDEIHLTDNMGEWDNHLAPGRGGIDFDLLFNLVNALSLRPVFTFEPHSVEDFIECMKFVDAHPRYFK